MGKQVQVKPSFTLVPLTIGTRSKLFSEGETVILTDAEYAALPAASSRALVVLNATVADPARTAPAVSAAAGDFLTRSQVEDLLASTSQSYALALPKLGAYGYDGSGRVTTDPEGNTYTYNSDDTIRTITRGSVTVTATYGSNGIASWV